MVYIIGIILVIIVLLTIGLILRKRVYDIVDRLENWKLEIMGRDVASQLSKLKKLNLSGNTQESFEKWKGRWEDILTRDLPDVEELLFDAEEAADRFRLSKSKKVLADIETRLKKADADIEIILKELDVLLESAKSSQEEVTELQPELKELRKKLSQNRYQYGKAELYFELEIDELDAALNTYEELTQEGNYIEAKNLVDELKEKKEQLETLIDEFPSTFKKCKYEVPSQLDQLLAGIKEMKADGYRVDHLAFEKEIQTYQGRLLDLLKVMEKGEVTQAKTMIDDIEGRISEMYQLLEKEAVAKNYLETKIPSYQQSLEELSSKYQVTKEELEEIKKAYFLEDSDVEKYLSLGKSLRAAQEQLEEIILNMENEGISHSEIRDKLENEWMKLEQFQEQLEDFKISIHNLRKEELEARDTLKEMNQQLYHLNKKLQRSNIPGVPDFIWNSIENTKVKNERVMEALEKIPLDMGEIQQALDEAAKSLEQTVEKTDLMLDQAYLTEQVIQYANRYRSKYPMLAAKLMEAERLFRSYQYELALETAAKALEEIEPGALKRFEQVPIEV